MLVRIFNSFVKKSKPPNTQYNGHWLLRMLYSFLKDSKPPNTQYNGHMLVTIFYSFVKDSNSNIKTINIIMGR